MKKMAKIRRAMRSAREKISDASGDADVNFFNEFARNGGLQLDERIWLLESGAEAGLIAAIREALGSRSAPSRAAADFLYAGRANDLIRPVESSLQVDAVDMVFRTEINRAHGEAFMASGEKTPGFAGWRYLLSPRHPAPDICNLLASQNLHGLGPGVYPTREACPWPAHPDTLSFVEMVFQDEVTDADRAGKETELEALQRLEPEIRAGVLGQTKAKYLERGILRRWMIRSPLKSVQRRLVRQGLLDSDELETDPGVGDE